MQGVPGTLKQSDKVRERPDIVGRRRGRRGGCYFTLLKIGFDIFYYMI